MTLFTNGVPAQESPIKSAEIRDNFTALFEKVKTLEARATDPISTSVLIEGGPVYFRSATSVLFNEVGEAVSGRLQFIDFKTTIIDLATANGYTTIKRPDGTLARQAITGGVSPFTQAGVFRELLITLNRQNNITFTEGATTTTGLSRPFDIAFDDSEIPICLVTIRQNGPLLQSGQLRTINQIDIKDVRPFVTSAFQNNLTSATLQLTVSDNTQRISAVERAFRPLDSFRVRIPLIEKLTVDGTRQTNKRLEVLSGSTYIDGQLVRFPGALVDIRQDLTTAIPVDNFNQVLVAVRNDGYGVGELELYHGLPSDSNSDRKLVKLPSAVTDGYGNLIPPSGSLPLALIYYRAESTPALGTTTDVKPVVSEIFIDPTFDVNSQVNGGVRFSHALDIVAINNSQEFLVQIPTDVSETSVFVSGQEIDMFDDNTRPIRRTISNNPQSTFNVVTRRMTIQVSETFVNDVVFPDTAEGISLKRNPKVIALSQHQTVIEDVRPFLIRQ